MTEIAESTHSIDAPPAGPRRALPNGMVMLLLAALIVAVAALVWQSNRVPPGVEVASFMQQGGGDEVYAHDAVQLRRRADGLSAVVSLPTPVPGSYEYPTKDILSPGAPPHPEIEPGSSQQPEAFTLWMFIFNYPERCTDQCDGDDIGTETGAMGGVFQVDGRIADGDQLEFAGGVRLGQVAGNGVALENPHGAEVHLAMAPHGKALDGAAGWRQLNGPVGAIPHWWATTFFPPEQT